MEHISQTVEIEHMSLAEVKQVLTTAAEQHNQTLTRASTRLYSPAFE
jgi:hypothetical protein